MNSVAIKISICKQQKENPAGCTALLPLLYIYIYNTGLTHAIFRVSGNTQVINE